MPPSLHNEGLAGGPPKFYTFVETPSGALLVGSCVCGVSRSRDAGATWQPVGELDHISINSFAVEPDGRLLAATSGGLWRSADDGSTWAPINDDPLHAVLSDGSDGPEGSTTFRLLRLRDGRKLAGTNGDGVWIGDGGKWTQLGMPGSIVYSLLETSSGTLLAGTRGDGVLRSDDGGATWSSPSNTPVPDVYVHCLVQLADGSVLAGTGLGISISTDDGRSWGSYASELHGHRIFAIRELADSRIIAGSYAHVWVGRDEKWRQVDPGLTPDEGWAVLFADDGAIYAGTKAGVMRSDDRGATWRNIAPGSVVFALAKTASGEILAGGTDGVKVGPDWRPVGEVGPRVYALFEVAPDHLLAGTLTEGLYTYEDGAWGPLAGGPPDWQIYQIIRSQSGRLLACSGAIINGEKDGSVYTSDDDGRSWVQTLSGRSYYKMTQTSDGTIYAGGRRCYISRSTDDGNTWELCPLPLGQESKMYSLAGDKAGRLFLGAGGQLLRSDDGAQSWTILDNGIDGVSVYDLREGPDGLLAAATSVGLFVSDDGGDNWHNGT
ncbi:MAG: hypothetical protein K8R99_09735 [Actinomycetia bacterium]|nr:hypothetical protein [Actinomycetes bacterium]